MFQSCQRITYSQADQIGIHCDEIEIIANFYF